MDGAASSQQAQEASALDQPAPEARDDLALTIALAQAARRVEHIVTLSAGRYGAVVTYGPGKRVDGIVLRRPTPVEGGPLPSSSVEAHIIIDTAVVVRDATPLSQQEIGQRLPPNRHGHAPESAEAPVLLRIADKTRQALAATLQQWRPHEMWDIDIVIEDLRDADNPATTRLR
jgi:hypothetical protein